MDIFKKYIISVVIAIVIVIIFVLFAPINWGEIKTPLGERSELIQNCIDDTDMTNQECMELYPVDNPMTRPLINVTDWFNNF